MTRNLWEYLGFPLHALNKDINIEAFFKDIFDDELEQKYLNGNRIEFDPNIIRSIMEEQDMDLKEGDEEMVS